MYPKRFAPGVLRARFGVERNLWLRGFLSRDDGHSKFIGIGHARYDPSSIPRPEHWSLWRCWFGSQAVFLVIYRQTAIQLLMHLHPGTSIA